MICTPKLGQVNKKALVDLSEKVKGLALDGLGWSSFRKVLSAIRNFLSGAGGVSSVHSLYKELNKEDMALHVGKLVEEVQGLEKKGKTV